MLKSTFCKWPQLANNCIVLYMCYCKDHMQEQKVAKCVEAGCIVRALSGTLIHIKLMGMALT